jgi:hypothetical protein
LETCVVHSPGKCCIAVFRGRSAMRAIENRRDNLGSQQCEPQDSRQERGVTPSGSASSLILANSPDSSIGFHRTRAPAP